MRGVLGNPVCEAFQEQGVAVVALGSRDGDLRDVAAAMRLLADADVIVHLAAKVGGVDYLRRNGVSAYYDNVTMGMNVVQASLTVAQRLVLIGTPCSYPAELPLPLCEDDTTRGWRVVRNGPLRIGQGHDFARRQSTACRRRQGCRDADSRQPVRPRRQFRAPIAGASWPRCCTGLSSPLGRAASVSKSGAMAPPPATCCILAIPRGPSLAQHSGRRATHREKRSIWLRAPTTIRELAETVAAAVDPIMSVEFDAGKPVGVQRRVMSIDKAGARLGFRPAIGLHEGVADTGGVDQYT